LQNVGLRTVELEEFRQGLRNEFPAHSTYNQIDRVLYEGTRLYEQQITMGI
jgi:hypothetical protein